LPSESLLIFSSALAARGDLSFGRLLLFAWIGSVLGDNIGYLIGKTLGRTIVLRYGERLGLTEERLRTVETVFARHGRVSVGFARFFYLLRQLNGVLAGALNMDCRQFLILNALGGAAWLLTWGIVGYYFGKHASSSSGCIGDFDWRPNHCGACLQA
jgi:membrane protein DedA with SNARE-associated domain